MTDLPADHLPGANNPPTDAPVSPFPAIEAHLSDLQVEAANWADGSPIRNQAQADEIGYLIDQLRKGIKAAEDAQASETKPHTDAEAAVRERYAPWIADTKKKTGKSVQALAACKAALGDYLARQEAIKRAEVDAARRKAEEAAQAAHDARMAADSSDLAAQAQAAEATALAEDLAQRAKVAERSKVGSFGGARAITMRTYRTAVCTDERAAMVWAWANHREEVLGFLLTIAQSNAANGRGTPGYRIEEGRRPA